MNQDIALPDTIIHYIIKSSPWILEKLNLTCKYWVVKYRYVFVGNIFHGSNCRGRDHLELKNDKFLTETALEKFSRLKVVITNTLSFTKYMHGHIEPSMVNLPTYLQKVYSCHLTKLYIQRQNLSFEEWNLLTESNSIKNIVMVASSIRYKNDSCVFVEDLFLNLLKVVEVHFWLSNEHFSLQTAQKLIDIKFCFKFKEFHLGLVPETFDFQKFYNFAKKNGVLKTLYGVYGELYSRVFCRDKTLKSKHGNRTQFFWQDESLYKPFFMFESFLYDTLMYHVNMILP